MDYSSSSNTSVNNRFAFIFPLFAILGISLIYFPTLASLFERWTKWDESLSHALVVLSLFFYLLFRTLPWSLSTRTTFDYLAPICLFISASLWYAGSLASISIIEQLALLLVVVFFLASSYSISILWFHRILFSLLIFTIPIWDQLNTPLVNLSGFVVGNVVSFISIPASIEGNSIFIPSGHIIIADGCSGLRYLEISMALGVIICLFNNYTEKQLIPVLLISIFLGLLANWLRIFILVLIGYNTEMKSSLMNDHEFFGWALFAIICFPAMYLAPVIKSTRPNASTPSQPHWITPSILVLIFPIAFHFTQWKPSDQHPKEILVNQGYAKVSKLHDLLIAPETPTLVESAELKSDGKVIGAQRLYYKKTNQDQKLVPYINHLFDTDSWLLTSSKKQNGTQYNIYKKKNNSLYAAQALWFQLGDYHTASVFSAKLLQIPALIKGVSIFTITSLEIDCEQAECTQEIKLLEQQVQLLKNIN